MRTRRAAALLALSLSTTLVLSACGGGGGDAAGDAQGDAPTISVFGTEPQNALLPGNTRETGGSKIVDALWSGLVAYTPEGEVENVVAESIETTDSQNFTITIEEGWTFHDGTPVTAQSFVDAWNYVAYAPNAQSSTAFFSDIAGYADVAPAEGEPTAETMSGLQVVDDRTFTVALSAPSPVFETTLGDVAFFPMPESFFADPAAFEENPIGNGPFRFESRVPDQNVTLTRYAEYGGDDATTNIGGVEFRFYADSEAAYQDVVSNNLDFLETIPGSALIDNIYQQDLPERNGNQPYAGINTMSFPIYEERYADPQLRQAISMAVDRQAIIDNVYNGLVEPATGVVPAGVPGYVADQCGELCTFQPERAKQQFDASGFDGPIELISNVDSAINREWMQAACISITNTLGVECNFVPVPTFAEFLEQRQSQSLTGLWRSGWIASQPTMEYVLEPQYVTGAENNDGLYSNPEFDALVEQGSRAASIEEAQALWAEAERVLLQDMPSVPINNQAAQFGWSERLDNVEMNYGRELELRTVTVQE
ncbi:ABC transporter substrate-binding protein [Pseudonocardia sp. NPDC049635]|uniref:peptide ABC transporter substrate-binding protein n=1 Tax=Pseudonocardia sp. NPDC049635 TaxID=3155506 RepID=UPI0033C1E706